MLKALSRRFDLSLGPQGAQLARRSGWLQPSYQLLESLEWSPQASDEQRGAELDALLLRHAMQSGDLGVLVADLWVPSVGVQPPAQGVSLDDLTAAVSLRLASVTDTAAPWELASAPRMGGRFVAGALRSSLMDMLRRLCQRHGIHLVSIQPVYVAVWNHWRGALKPGQWLAICGADAVTLCVAPGRHLEQLRRLDLEAAHTREAGWAVEAAQREALRMGVTAPTTLALCGKVPQPWRSAPAVYLGPVGDAAGLWGVQ